MPEVRNAAAAPFLTLAKPGGKPRWAAERISSVWKEGGLGGRNCVCPAKSAQEAGAGGEAIVTESGVMHARHNRLQKGNVNQRAKLSKTFRKQLKVRKSFLRSPFMNLRLSQFGDRPCVEKMQAKRSTTE
jgi:hypothetical protein